MANPKDESLAESARHKVEKTIDTATKIEDELRSVSPREARKAFEMIHEDYGIAGDSLAAIAKRAQSEFRASAFGPPVPEFNPLKRDPVTQELVYRTPDIVTSGKNDKREEEIYQQVSEALKDATPEERARFTGGVLDVLNGKRRTYNDTIQGKKAEFKYEPANRLSAARNEINWIIDNPLTIGRVNESAVYKLEEAGRAKKVLFVTLEDGDDVPDDIAKNFSLKNATKFLIQHDWASAFQSAEGFQGSYEFQMPSEHCTFEGRISGRRFIVEYTDATGHQDQLGVPNTVFLWIETEAGWSLLHVHMFTGYSFVPIKPDRENIIPSGLSKVVEFLFSQIKAASIALEAEVAVREIVRAPHKLNRAREKSGKLPLYDYHVINLANRKRVTALPPEYESDEKRRSPRWHFVRPHYRHFQNHKVWVLAYFRGDPDLGIIEKHYRL